MSRLIKILHIDPDYRITYLIYRNQSSIRTSVPLQKAIELLKKEDFDLIISEPHNQAILKKEPYALKSEPVWSGDQTFMEANPGDLREVQSNRYSQNQRGNPSFILRTLDLPGGTATDCRQSPTGLPCPKNWSGELVGFNDGSATRKSITAHSFPQYMEVPPNSEAKEWFQPFLKIPSVNQIHCY